MLPITGPFYKESSSLWDVERKTWFRQRPPFNRPLQYSLRKGWARRIDTVSQYGAPQWVSLAESQYSETKDAVYTKVYSRFVDQLGDGASLGVSLAQWKEADGMIRNRASQLGRFTTALAKRSPVGVAASLGLRLRDVQALLRKKHGASKKLSDLWLEFWFGWKPMVSDIYAASEVFDQEIPAGLVKASAKLVEPKTRRWGFDGGNPYESKGEWSTVHKCRMGCQVQVTNPNLRLMQQFGVLNPAEVAWDLVPWSFVVGWFSNVGTWLSSFTDFAGITTSQGYLSHSVVIDGDVWMPAVPRFGSSGIGTYVSRELIAEPPRPRLQLSLKQWQPTRAATAISLLIQKLPRR